MKSLIAFLILCVSSLPLHAQSLAEAAKKAEEAHAAAAAKKPSDKKAADKTVDDKKADASTTAKPEKVYTNKDLKDVPPSPLAPSSPEAAPSTLSTAAPTATTTDDKPVVKDEAYWRARIAPFQKKVRDNLAKEGPFLSRIDDLTAELSGIGPLNARRGGVETERQRLITEVASLQETLRTDMAAIQAIEEEGRRAGALPGWFR